MIGRSEGRVTVRNLLLGILPFDISACRCFNYPVSFMKINV